MFSGAVQASDPPPMPWLGLVEQVEGEGRSHGGGNHRTSEHLADDGDGVGDGVGDGDGVGESVGLGDNGQRS